MGNAPDGIDYSNGDGVNYIYGDRDNLSRKCILGTREPSPCPISLEDNDAAPPNAVKALDKRDTNKDEDGKPNPDIQVLNSYKITDRADQVGILTLIHKYVVFNPSVHTWKRTQVSLLIEWDMHNLFAFADQSARDVDFDNKEEKAGYIYYFGKAASRGIKKIINNISVRFP